MTRPAAFASALLVLFVSLMVSGGALAIRNGEDALGNNTIAVFAVPFGLVGTLLLWRRPRNRVAWVMTAIAVSFALWFLARQYAVFTLVTEPGSLPEGVFALWLTTGFADLGWALSFTFLPLLFPDGEIPSRRWRPVALLAAMVVVFNVVQGQLLPHHDLVVPPGAYPFGLSSHPELRGRLVAPVFLLFYLPVVIACFTAPLVRFRAAGGIERQQLKWFLFATVILFGGLFLDLVPTLLSDEGRQQFGRSGLRLEFVSGTILVAAILAVPAAIGIAILRYRLYDIDVLINRTLVYGLTTAAIAVTFFGGIVVLQTPLRALTGGSELAVAVSTLASFALFQPLRARVQTSVDRRFYRSRYDAVRTLDEFSVRLRDEVDLDDVRSDLLDALDRTVQPASASVWLREPTP
jgi:hypothetical protein